MNDKIKEELQQGEKLLWTGKTEAFEILDTTYKKHIIQKAVLIIGIVAVLCIVYVLYASSNAIEIKYALIWIALICALMGAVSSFTEGKKLKQASYAITDRRIISFIGVPKSLEFSHINCVDFKTDSDGHTSVLFGNTAIKAKAHQRRTLALLDPYIDEESGKCSRFVMYAVPDVEGIKNILGKYINI